MKHGTTRPETHDIVRCVDCEVELHDENEARCYLCQAPLCSGCIGEMGDQVCEDCDFLYSDDEDDDGY